MEDRKNDDVNEKEDVIRYLNHETLGQLNIFKTTLNEEGKNKYTLLKVENKTFEPYVVAFCLDEKDGRWQQGTYFNDYKYAENCFRIKSDLSDSYSEVIDFLQDYNKYLNATGTPEGEEVDAYRLINEFNYEVNLMGTTEEDNEENFIGMSYDLKTNTLKYYLNDKLIAQESYCLDDLTKDLSYEDFDIFYGATMDKIDEYRKGVEVDRTVFFRDEETLNEPEPNTDSLEMLKEQVAQKLNTLMYDYDPYGYGDSELTSSNIGINAEGNNYDMCLDMINNKEYSKIDEIIADIVEDSVPKEFEDKINDINNDLKTLKGLQMKNGIKTI